MSIVHQCQKMNRSFAHQNTFSQRVEKIPNEDPLLWWCHSRTCWICHHRKICDGSDQKFCPWPAWLCLLPLSPVLHPFLLQIPACFYFFHASPMTLHNGQARCTSNVFSRLRYSQPVWPEFLIYRHWGWSSRRLSKQTADQVSGYRFLQPLQFFCWISGPQPKRIPQVHPLWSRRLFLFHTFSEHRNQPAKKCLCRDPGHSKIFWISFLKNHHWSPLDCNELQPASGPHFLVFFHTWKVDLSFYPEIERREMFQPLLASIGSGVVSYLSCIWML